MKEAGLKIRDVFDQLFEGIYFVDVERRIFYFNPAAEQITGYSRNEMIGQMCFHDRLCHVDERGEQACHEFCPLARTIAERKTIEVEYFFRHKDGHRVPVNIRVIPFFNNKGEVTGAAELFSPSVIPPHREEIENLKKMAMLDQVTNICNRRYAELKIREKLGVLERYHLSFGLLFMDIDRFKTVNDTYGHDVGDEVLRMVAKTLSANIRSGDTVCRWGGEEFVATFSGVSDKTHLAMIADKLRVLVARSSLKRGEQEISVKISIGATLARVGDTVEEVVKRADTLMYEVKKKGGDAVSI